MAWALESRLCSRIVLGCSNALARKGGMPPRGKKKHWAPWPPPYVWPVAIDTWHLSGPARRGGGGGWSKTEDMRPPPREGQRTPPQSGECQRGPKAAQPSVTLQQGRARSKSGAGLSGPNKRPSPPP